jgi:imidazole glycerol-phosphate synthase subunit HisH
MITIVDYKAGNLTSVKRALDHLGIENRISKDPDIVRNAERVIFPGVGAAGAAMEVLRERGLDSALKESFLHGTPILGICIGCQIILTHSEEDDTPCLDLISGETVRFHLSDPALKIPHMGWNAVTVTQSHPILSHLHPDDEFYFVHSYYPQPEDPSQVYAVCDYGGEFSVAIGVANLFAVQFHAEKSGPLGLQLLQNFSEWRP